MKAVVLIGGFGTRLRPFTLHTPKPLLPLLGRPFLSYQIERLKAFGIRDIVLCTSYRPKDFRKTYGHGRRLGVRLTYVHENQPLGTGGAIKNAERYVNGTTLICNGDILMDLNLSKFLRFHRQRKAIASIALTHVQDPTAYGLIETDRQGRVRRFIEKPTRKQATCHTINAGFYFFEPELFSLIPKNQVCSIEREVFPALLSQNGPLYAREFPGYWLDMGTIDKYAQAHYDLLVGKFPGAHPQQRVLEMVKGYPRA